MNTLPQNYSQILDIGYQANLLQRKFEDLSLKQKILARVSEWVHGYIQRLIFTHVSSPLLPKPLEESILAFEKKLSELANNTDPELLEVIQDARESLAFLFSLAGDEKQHRFAQEYGTKTIFDQMLPVEFPFRRSIVPVLKDNDPRYTVLKNLQKRKITDIHLMDGIESISFKKDGIDAIKNSRSGQNLEKIRELMKQGKRVLFVLPHPGYAGAYLPRAILRMLGYDDIAKNWNVIAGPRVVANDILRHGVYGIGNLWMTLPTTTPIQTEGLAQDFSSLVRKTMRLVKTPTGATPTVSWEEGEYNLFQKNRYNPFVVFPEGSRSVILPNGIIEIKEVDTSWIKMLREGDYILCGSQSGAEKMNPKGSFFLKPAELYFAFDKPFEVTKEMIKSPETTSFSIMKQMETLPLGGGGFLRYPFNEQGERISS